MSIRLMHPLARSIAVGLCGQATAEWADNLSEGSQFCTRCEPLVILGAGDSYPFIYGRLCKIFWGLGSPRGCCEGQVHYPPPHDRRIFPRKICQETQRCIVRIFGAQFFLLFCSAYPNSGSLVGARSIVVLVFRDPCLIYCRTVSPKFRAYGLFNILANSLGR